MLQNTCEHENERQHCSKINSLLLIMLICSVLLIEFYFYQHWKTICPSFPNASNLVLAENTYCIYLRSILDRLSIIMLYLLLGHLHSCLDVKRQFLSKLKCIYIFNVYLKLDVWIEMFPINYFTFQYCYCWNVWSYEWELLWNFYVRKIFHLSIACAKFKWS